MKKNRRWNVFIDSQVTTGNPFSYIPPASQSLVLQKFWFDIQYVEHESVMVSSLGPQLSWGMNVCCCRTPRAGRTPSWPSTARRGGRTWSSSSSSPRRTSTSSRATARPPSTKCPHLPARREPMSWARSINQTTKPNGGVNQESWRGGGRKQIVACWMNDGELFCPRFLRFWRFVNLHANSARLLLVLSFHPLSLSLY